MPPGRAMDAFDDSGDVGLHSSISGPFAAQSAAGTRSIFFAGNHIGGNSTRLILRGRIEDGGLLVSQALTVRAKNNGCTSLLFRPAKRFFESNIGERTSVPSPGHYHGGEPYEFEITRLDRACLQVLTGRTIHGDICQPGKYDHCDRITQQGQHTGHP